MIEAIQAAVTVEALIVFGEVILIDLVFAADNAIAIGLVASQIPAEKRRTVIIVGIAAAAVMRVGFALLTVQLLAMPWVMLAAGIMLAWVAIKLGIDTAKGAQHGSTTHGRKREYRGIWHAGTQILIADLTMSIDNVVAVASAARHHPVVLVIGLVVAVIAMGTGAGLVTKVLDRYRWLAWVGIGIIAWVALSITWDAGTSLIGVR